LVDEPDPEEKKLAVYAETEIRKYLKQEKIRRIEERKKLVTMLLELKKEEE
jgi:predicted GIY-YIG superfamily endonuclease